MRPRSLYETTIDKGARCMHGAAERANWVALFERSGKHVTLCRGDELALLGLFDSPD